MSGIFFAPYFTPPLSPEKLGKQHQQAVKNAQDSKSGGNFVVNLQLNVLNICTQETYKLRALIFLYIFAQQNMIMAINLSSQW